ncbi:hypothetical protein D5071_13920 [Pectobacterium carotovorum]|uniref:Uncharacterized protein n=1 Tax=Pectobacterium carotovorum TaxID=554 RepID=A0A419AUJ7_PECCA|nr:hypothetical protein D5071_13920 [Pectobacterium carotovorum]
MLTLRCCASLAKTEEQALCQPENIFITLIFNQLFFTLSIIVPFFASAHSTKLQVIAIRNCNK